MLSIVEVAVKQIQIVVERVFEELALDTLLARHGSCC
jgi:hypothetical protein